MIMTTAFVSMPSFIMGSLLLIIFCKDLGWLPANGAAKGGLILPIVTLALYPMSYITRLTRSSMLDVLGQDYIRTARAKGVSERDVIVHHALKNSLIPVITYFGPELAYIVTGSLGLHPHHGHHHRPRHPHRRDEPGERHSVQGRRPAHHAGLGR